MTYVNYLGDEIGLIDHGRAPKAKREPESFHKGWRVRGVPPGMLDEARAAHQRLVNMARNSGGEAVAPFDAATWLMNAKAAPVRSKPYSIRQAADECAALATKAGWLRVEIEEIKRGEAPTKSTINRKPTKCST